MKDHMKVYLDNAATTALDPLVIEEMYRFMKDDFGNPIIYYRGIVSETEKVDDDGVKEEISALKEDIKKLLDE